MPGHRVAACVLRTGGQLSEVYEASFSDDTDPLIIKICADAWRWKQARETHVYQLLDQHLIGPIPRILHTGVAPEQLGGHGYTVMTLLPGQPLSAVSARLGESEIFGVYRQMGSILAALHRISRNAFGYLTTTILDPKPANTVYMTEQFGKKLREFSALGGDAALRAAIERYVGERAGLFAASRTCFRPGRSARGPRRAGTPLIAGSPLSPAGRRRRRRRCSQRQHPWSDVLTSWARRSAFILRAVS